MQRLRLLHIHSVNGLGRIQGVAIGHPVDTLVVFQQLLPRCEVDRLHRVALIHLVQFLNTNPVLNGPFHLHHALGVFLAVAHHLQEVLIQTLLGCHLGLLLLVGIGIVFLCQRRTAMGGLHHQGR